MPLSVLLAVDFDFRPRQHSC